MDLQYTTRRCTKCGVEKPLAEFSKSNAHTGGYHLHCKACYKVWYDANKDRVKAKKKAQRAADPETFRERERTRYYATVDYIRSRKQRWYQKNTDKRRAERSRYYWSHVDSERAKGRLRYQQNSEHLRQQRRIWCKANRDICRAAFHRYKARKRANGGSFTANEWRALCAHYGHCCLCCGEQKPLTIDHIVPVSKGGSNDISNIQPLCLRCNDQKNNKTIDYRDRALQ